MSKRWENNAYYMRYWLILSVAQPIITLNPEPSEHVKVILKTWGGDHNTFRSMIFKRSYTSNWRYMVISGFFFDKKLSSCQHIHYYANNTLSMIKDMKMLGNSTRLFLMHKWLLYRIYVLLIIFYRF